VCVCVCVCVRGACVCVFGRILSGGVIFHLLVQLHINQINNSIEMLEH